jgi:AraC-like DNA-binding protein
MARPRKSLKLDEEQVQQLASLGHSDAIIAVLAGVSENTLLRRFGAYLKLGRAQLHQQIRTLQLQRARDGSDTMLIWLGKCVLGQREHIEQTVHTESRIVIDIGDDIP